tara:strand:+ start:2310 stop:3149 length:840 start_codon:yes stop_codon:yes gene_type:complete
MILWLASYPKSGNTFLRSLLASYFYTKDGNFNFDLLKKIKQFPVNENFSQIGIDIKNKYLVAENYIKAQEEINKSKKLTFLKTHSSFCKMFNKFNFSNLKNSLGVIYIVRDPRNVVISFARHNSQSIETTSELLITDLATGNEKNEVEVYLGSWNFNYNSWKVYQNSKKYLLIKYEDLVNNTQKTFTEILKFINNISKINSEIDIKKIKKIVKETTFSRMKHLENEYGFVEAKINDNTGQMVKFFNQGPENDWKNILNDEIKKKIELKFHQEMKELGYL